MINRGDFLITSFSQLKEKEVINICDGKRLGYICDILIDTDIGKICTLYISDGVFTFSEKKRFQKIDWCQIKCIGEDTILVEQNDREQCEVGCRDEKVEKKKCRRLIW